MRYSYLNYDLDATIKVRSAEFEQRALKKRQAVAVRDRRRSPPNGQTLKETVTKADPVIAPAEARRSYARLFL